MHTHTHKKNNLVKRSSLKRRTRLLLCCWHLAFCHCFSKPLGTFSSKMKPLQKRGKVMRIREERWEKMASGFKEC